MKKIKIVFLLVASLLISCAPIYADTYKDSKFKFQITSSNTWESKAYSEGPDRLFDTMSPDQNVLVRVRAIHLSDPIAVDILRKVYEREYLKGSSLYQEESTIINGIKGHSFFYHWKYNGHDINVVSWFAILPKMAYIVSRIIPNVILNDRVTEADKVVNTFQSSLSNSTPEKGTVVSKPSVLPAKPVTTISLIPEKSNFTPKQKITVKFSGLPAKGQDWLALSAVNHKADEYFDMVMLQGKPRSGTHSFTGLPEGNYEIRAYTNWPDGGYTITTKIGISVKKASATPKVPVAMPASPKKPIASTPAPAKPIVQKPAKPVDTIADVVTNTPATNNDNKDDQKTKYSPQEHVSVKDTPKAPKGMKAPPQRSKEGFPDHLPPLNAPKAPEGMVGQFPKLTDIPEYNFRNLTVKQILDRYGNPSVIEISGSKDIGKDFDSFWVRKKDGMVVAFGQHKQGLAEGESWRFRAETGKVRAYYKHSHGKTVGNQLNFGSNNTLISTYSQGGNGLDGPSYSYNPEGQLRWVKNYKPGSTHRYGYEGVQYEFDEAGNLTSEKNFKDGHIYGPERSYKDGLLTRSINRTINGLSVRYYDGRLESWSINFSKSSSKNTGPWQQYGKKTGKNDIYLQAQGFRLEGKSHGHKWKFGEDGNVKSIEEYQHGKQQGTTWTFYKGRMTKIKEYQAGKQHGTSWSFTDAGKTKKREWREGKPL